VVELKLRSNDWRDRIEGCRLLVEYQGAAAQGRLLEIAKTDENEKVRQAAVLQLAKTGHWGAKQILNFLSELRRNPMKN